MRIDENDNTLASSKSQSIVCEKPTTLQNKNEKRGKTSCLNLSKLKPIHTINGA